MAAPHEDLRTQPGAARGTSTANELAKRDTGRPELVSLVSDIEQQAPPVGEEIHLPGPSVLPLLCAVGITLAVIGTTINWLISIVGA